MSYEEIASYESVFNDIKRVLEQGRRRAVAHVNHEMLVTYWNVGRIIVEHEQANPDRAEYGAATLKRLSRIDRDIRQGVLRIEYSVHETILSCT